jgi:formylglycine-generating enzyme required for sulfatase activity
MSENGSARAYDLESPCWTAIEEAEEALGKRRAPAGWDAQNVEGRRSCPVVGVSWFEAVAYCQWLNLERTGSASGPYRLPSEAEREKAARGLFGRRWPWGCSWRPKLVACREEGSPSFGQAMPVPVDENLNISPFGVQGMAGNVMEWCSTRWQDQRFGTDLFSERAIGAVQDGETIPLRGGSFFSLRGGARCAYRVRHGAGGRDRYRGFRCARDVG